MSQQGCCEVESNLQEHKNTAPAEICHRRPNALLEITSEVGHPAVLALRNLQGGMISIHEYIETDQAEHYTIATGACGDINETTET